MALSLSYVSRGAGVAHTVDPLNDKHTICGVVIDDRYTTRTGIIANRCASCARMHGYAKEQLERATLAERSR